MYIPHRKYQVNPHSSPWFSATFAAAIVHINHLFHLYQQNKSSESKVKFRQASNHCKRVLEAAKFAFANKTKGSITYQKFGSWDIWGIANSVLNKGKLAIPPLFNSPDCEPELSYTLAQLFNKCLKESSFPDCWKVSSVVPVFKNVGESSTAKNYCPVSLLSVVSKVFQKLVNNRIVDHLEKCGLFSAFQYGFRSSRSTADLLTVVSDRIARTFNRSGATQAVALGISKAFDMV